MERPDMDRISEQLRDTNRRLDEHLRRLFRAHGLDPDQLYEDSYPEDTGRLVGVVITRGGPSVIRESVSC